MYLSKRVAGGGECIYEEIAKEVLKCNSIEEIKDKLKDIQKKGIKLLYVEHRIENSSLDEIKSLTIYNLSEIVIKMIDYMEKKIEFK
jgi:hypothetical protein